VQLPEPPVDLTLSPDGTRAAVLGATNALQVIGNPVEWASTTGATPGSDRIREAQSLLLALRFPVGSVDGMDGPTTQRAVRIFQESAGIAPTGRLDPSTFDRILEVAREATPGAGPARGDFDDPVLLGQCEVVPPEERCNSRFQPNQVSSVFDGLSTEEIICGAPSGGALPVQIDTYTLTPSSSEYQCTSYHSCPFIRYRELFAYRSICAGEEVPLRSRVQRATR
jgi:hypothetical protein